MEEREKMFGYERKNFYLVKILKNGFQYPYRFFLDKQKCGKKIYTHKS